MSNPNNVANITSYEWNLGSSGNSWLYNGSVAPQNISTSTNSITLTPVCGNNLSNVSVTVKVNNQNYKTYSCTVSNTNPTLSINGSSAFCSGTSTYSINNLPCNTSVTWSISPAGPASLSCTSCSSTTLTLVTAGAATLTATVNGGCTPNTVLTKTIYLSIPTADFSVLPFNPDERFCINSFGNRIKVEPQPVAGVTSFRWGYSSYENGVPPTIYQDPGTTEQDFIFTVAGQYEIYATSENACGTGNAETLDIIVYDDCAGGFGFAVFNISPNPATGAVRVSSANQTSVIKEIRISDKAGTVKKRFTYTMNTKSVTINISSLPADVYYLQIFDGSKWVTKPIIKK